MKVWIWFIFGFVNFLMGKDFRKEQEQWVGQSVER